MLGVFSGLEKKKDLTASTDTKAVGLGAPTKADAVTDLFGGMTMPPAGTKMNPGGAFRPTLGVFKSVGADAMTGSRDTPMAADVKKPNTFTKTAVETGKFAAKLLTDPLKQGMLYKWAERNRKMAEAKTPEARKAVDWEFGMAMAKMMMSTSGDMVDVTPNYPKPNLTVKDQTHEILMDRMPDPENHVPAPEPTSQQDYLTAIKVSRSTGRDDLANELQQEFSDKFGVHVGDGPGAKVNLGTDNLYHGTKAGGVDVLKTGGYGNQGQGIYLTNDESIAGYHAMSAQDNVLDDQMGRMPYQAERQPGTVMGVTLKDGANIVKLDYMPTEAEVEALKSKGIDGVEFPDHIVREDWDVKLNGPYPKGGAAKTTMVFNPDMVSVGTLDPVPSALLKEAAKYSSPEEFTDNLGSFSRAIDAGTAKDFKSMEDTIQFHGTYDADKLRQGLADGAVFDNPGKFGKGLYMTSSNNLAKNFAVTRRGGGGRVPETIALDVSGANLYHAPYDFFSYEGSPNPDKFIEGLKKKGFDGMILDGQGETVVWNTSKIKEINLADIWKQAKGFVGK